MIKNIIFDWSGVVKDAFKSQLYAVNKIFKTFGIREISLEELMENWEQPHMNFYNKYLPNLTQGEQDKIYKQAMLKLGPGDAYPGIAELIKRLKEKGMKMVVLSSDLPETLLREVKNFGLEGIFDEIMTNIHDKEKVIHDLIKNNNFDPKETMFVGDTNHEIEVGKKAGIQTCSVAWGLCKEDKLRAMSPDFLAHNLEELEGIIVGHE